MHRSRLILAGALAVLAAACMVRPAPACDVPVVRYALERWEADAYHAVVFHRGALDAGASAAYDVLRAATPEGGGHANLEVHMVDLDGELSDAMRPLWQREPGQVPKHGLYRWHIPDPLRFHQDLRATVQALGWWPDGVYEPLTDDLASVGYWYQREPQAPFPALADRRGRHARITPV